MQFGFIPGCEVRKTIFILTHLQDKYAAKKEKCAFLFTDLEKAFD